MNQDQKNRRLAELLGWKNVHLYEDDAGPPILSGDPPPTYKKRHQYDTSVPDYTHDLNAVHAVEMNLTIEQRPIFRGHLAGEFILRSEAVHATAEQRVDALIKALENQ